MFWGTYAARLDRDDRVVLPAGLHRSVAAEPGRAVSLVLTCGRRPSRIDIFTQEAWARFLEEEMRLCGGANEAFAEATRHLISSASSVGLDRRHRFAVPPVLRVHAGIERDVVFVGLASRIELWSRDRWTERCSARSRDRILPGS